MFFQTQYRVGELPIAIAVREIAEKRMSGTCFRGMDKKVAGNFFAFAGVWEILDINKPWFADFVAHIHKTYHEGSQKVAAYSFDYGQNVGWASADTLFKYDEENMEEFQPSRYSYAMRIKASQTHLLAPLTQTVTLVYEICPEENQIVAVVHWIYPGKDMGEFCDNISQREGIVFFDRNHPGESL